LYFAQVELAAAGRGSGAGRGRAGSGRAKVGTEWKKRRRQRNKKKERWPRAASRGTQAISADWKIARLAEALSASRVPGRPGRRGRAKRRGAVKGRRRGGWNAAPGGLVSRGRETGNEAVMLARRPS
jgi:hypothetical protein